jgi:hypothetical protein
MNKLTEYIVRKYGVTEDKFLQVCEKSPGAEGYLLGNIGEELFKEYAESKGYEVLRIKEKPEGGNNAKSEDARGDFYIRKGGTDVDEYYVIECKGVKSNAEKRVLANDVARYNLLKKHSFLRSEQLESILKSGKKKYANQKAKYEAVAKKSFPQFNWNQDNPGPGIPNLKNLWKDEADLANWLKQYPEEAFSDDAYWDLKAPLRLIQTHMPSSRVDPVTGQKSTGPLVTEFNILCVDLFLKTGRHEFVFANATQLNHQAASPNHLQQNYTIDILVEKDNFSRHPLLPPWYDSLDECIAQTKPKPRPLDPTQLDGR